MIRHIAKIAFILFAISAVCTALCAVVNEITAPAIALNTEGSRIEALEAVSAGYEIGAEEEGNGGDIAYRIPLTENGELRGYILQLSSSGYGGELTIVASYSLDGTLLSAKLMGNSETPGLGKKAEEDWYMAMFQGKGGVEPIPVTKSMLPADLNAQVSGATITFTGVSSALSAGSEYVKGLGGGV